MSNPISATITRARFGASIVALAPAVMLVGLFAHPYIAILPDEAAVAETATADTTRWGLVHPTVGVASGLLVLALRLLRIARAADAPRGSTTKVAAIPGAVAALIRRARRFPGPPVGTLWKSVSTGEVSNRWARRRLSASPRPR